MKDLVYILTNGKVVRTLKDAQLSGQGYKAEYREVPQPTVVTPKRAEMLKAQEYVKPVRR